MRSQAEIDGPALTLAGYGLYAWDVQETALIQASSERVTNAVGDELLLNVYTGPVTAFGLADQGADGSKGS